jgi:hypothetical protein
MLKQMIFAPCEKVILGQDRTASLISVLESIQIQVNEDLPEDALAPIPWNVLSLWRRTETTETPIEFEERLQVTRPDGSAASGASTKFRVSNEHLLYRNVTHVPTFPVGRPGVVWVKNQLRRINPETEWESGSEYPVLVIHLIPTATDDQSQPESAPTPTS